jgi:hypothetical protein
MSSAGARIAELRAHPAFFNSRHAEHAEIMRQYRSAVFSAMSTEEAARLAGAPDAEIRQMFGVADARTILPPTLADEWSGDAHQGDAVLFLAREGVEPRVIAEMSEDAIRRLAAYHGDRVPDDEVEAFVGRYKNRVLEAPLTRLVKCFREEVEGGGA